MRHAATVAACVGILVTGSPLTADGCAQTLTDSRLKLANWVTGLSAPTMFAFIGPDELLVIQKNDGMVRYVKAGVIQGTALDLNVNSNSERGGLGIAIDPDFAVNGYVYVSYSASTTSGDSSASDKWLDNRVERYTWNGATLGNVFGPLVAFPSDTAQSNGPNHDGGPIRFGPDGKLYGQTGDLNRGRFGGTARIEQNTATSGSATVGGIFRLNTDGTIPSDNPFTGESDSALHLWWSYGLRNGYGMCFDPVNGELWNTENGPNLYDEVCRVPKGMNSGWLKIMGPDSRDATYGENNNTAYDESDLVALSNSDYLDPELSFKTPIGITAIGFIGSTLFPDDLVDNCVFGDNNHGNLYYCAMKPSRLEFKLPSGLGDKVADTTGERNKIQWGSGFGVVTDAQIGPDGYLYVVNHTGNRIIRIRPVTDEVDPFAWISEPGTKVNGTEANADTSDDTVYTFVDQTLLGHREPFRVGASFKLQSTAPTTLVLEVETRMSKSGTPQQIEAENVVTGTWDTLDGDLIGTTDVFKSIAIAVPADYIDPATFEMKVRVSALPLPWPAAPRKIAINFDLLRLLATYP
jgi:glucose/arabinose dehydrogenase